VIDPAPAIAVRAIEARDHARWEPLWEAYNAFYGRKDATALSPAITEATWRRFHDPDEPVHALVAERGDALVGIAHYLFHRSTIAIEPSCYLQDLYTVEALRGTGIGAALIAAVRERARGAGASRLYWQTHEGNATAMRLYDRIAERSGFVVYRMPLEPR